MPIATRPQPSQKAGPTKDLPTWQTKRNETKKNPEETWLKPSLWHCWKLGLWEAKKTCPF